MGNSKVKQKYEIDTAVAFFFMTPEALQPAVAGFKLTYNLLLSLVRIF